MEKNARGVELPFNFGTFEGFNFRHQSAIEGNVTADEILAWDHDEKGEAEFWPSGDCEGVALVFKGQTSVTASELSALADLLDALGGDCDENYLKVHHALNLNSRGLSDLDHSAVEDEAPMMFWAENFIDARKDAAYELFETFFPDLYRMWESTPCDGLVFDPDQFLDSPSWATDEIRFGARKVLLVSPQ